MLPSSRRQQAASCPWNLSTVPTLDPCGKPFCQRRDLRVVRSHNEDVLKPEGMGFALLVRPSRPGPQQIIHRRGDSFDFFRRLVLVSRVLNRGKAQTSPAQRIAER